MKKMRLSARLFISFGLILVLLVAVVAIEYLSINQINTRNDQSDNAHAISNNIQLMRQWTLDYNVTHSDESAKKVDEYYQNSKSLIEQGVTSYHDNQDVEEMEEMKMQLDSYYDSYTQYKLLVDQNEVYYKDMLDSMEGIFIKVKQIIGYQQKDFRDISEKVENSKSEKKIDIYDLAVEMQIEYQELLSASEAVEAAQMATSAELRYLFNGDEADDDEVYAQVEVLNAQANWLTENKYRTAAEGMRKNIDTFVTKYEAYKELLSEQKQYEMQLQQIALEIVEEATLLAENHGLKMKNVLNNTLLMAVGIGIVSIIVGVLLSFVISRGLAKQLASNTEKLAQSAKLVSSASSQLSTASQELSSGSSQQASSVEETSATMDETLSMVKRNVENTQHANNLSKDAREAATIGSHKIQNMNESMAELKKSSNEIAKIISVIDDIAFQTNMLALNAAVEAARAGDAGLGFAVVAEEVRNLAQKSAQAAKDTSEIIDSNIALSQYGVEISGDVNNALDKIMSKTDYVNRIIGEITIASEEQEKGTSQVTKAIAEMEAVIQTNASTAQQTEESANELRIQAQTLESVVLELNEMVKGVEKKGKKKIRNIKRSKDKKVIKQEPFDNSLVEPKTQILLSNDVIPLDNEDDF